MEITTLVVGRLQANCYIVACEETKKAAIIDPGGDPDKIIQSVQESDYEIEYIFNTHGHMDHVEANGPVQKVLGGKLAIHPADESMLPKFTGSLLETQKNGREKEGPDLYLNDQDEIRCGKLIFKALHTPGHTPGGVCLLVEDNLFSGDTLFSGSVGRWDFSGGSYGDLMHSLKHKLMGLSDSVVIYPGHGPSTTIGFERIHNPFLQ
jgi:hydroxyacylglutathione hydrolase